MEENGHGNWREHKENMLRCNEQLSVTSEDLGRLAEKVTRDRKEDLRFVDMLEARMSTSEVAVKQLTIDLTSKSAANSSHDETAQAVVKVIEAQQETTRGVESRLSQFRDEIRQLCEMEFADRIARHEELVVRNTLYNNSSVSQQSANLSAAVAEEVKREIESSFYSRNEVDSIMLSQMMTVVGRLNQKVDVTARVSNVSTY
eukprot:GILJ01028877.1.p1 GENE.GILJ01028877.1~~GILJ01028877.1.p1  ORF type:complete len:218 (-),score=40.67 GILJ01028877.1:32-637(-)